jgi:hypothetical protein
MQDEQRLGALRELVGPSGDDLGSLVMSAGDLDARRTPSRRIAPTG